MDNLSFPHGGNIYEVKKILKKEVIDFSANINPLGLPAMVKRAIYANVNEIIHYPDPEARNITQKIARYWQINEQNILLGNGSIELIYLVMSRYKPKTTYIVAPTFSEYERAAKGVKSRIRFLNLKEKENFSFNLSYFAKPYIFENVKNKADVFFVCNPNNPTGNLILEDCASINKLTNKLLVVDEAFIDFLPNQKDYTLIWRAIKTKKIIVLRTFTKFFALPGLRIGYLVAHKEVVDKLRQHQVPWNINSLAQIAVEQILNDKEYINRTYKLIKKERDFLFEQLAKIEGLKPYPSVTNFLLIKIEKADITSESLRKSLIENGILIRDCSNFRNLNNKYIRVAVRLRKENLKLLEAFKKAI